MKLVLLFVLALVSLGTSQPVSCDGGVEEPCEELGPLYPCYCSPDEGSCTKASCKCVGNKVKLVEEECDESEAEGDGGLMIGGMSGEGGDGGMPGGEGGMPDGEGMSGGDGGMPDGEGGGMSGGDGGMPDGEGGGMPGGVGGMPDGEGFGAGMSHEAIAKYVEAMKCETAKKQLLIILLREIFSKSQKGEGDGGLSDGDGGMSSGSGGMSDGDGGMSSGSGGMSDGDGGMPGGDGEMSGGEGFGAGMNPEGIAKYVESMNCEMVKKELLLMLLRKASS